MQMIPVEQRLKDGSFISNVVNSFSVLWKYALARNDKMIALQK